MSIYYHTYRDLSIVHIAQTCWIEKVERSYINENPLAHGCRERLKKYAPMVLPTGTIYSIHLHERGEMVFDKVHIFFSALDSYRDGIFQIFKISVGQVAEAGDSFFDCPKGQASHQVIDKGVFQGSHCKFLLDLSSTLL